MPGATFVTQAKVQVCNRLLRQQQTEQFIQPLKTSRVPPMNQSLRLAKVPKILLGQLKEERKKNNTEKIGEQLVIDHP